MSFDINKLKKQIEYADFMKTTVVSLNVEYARDLLEHNEYQEFGLKHSNIIKQFYRTHHEIFILKGMLNTTNIRFDFTERPSGILGWQIIVYENQKTDTPDILCDVIQNTNSYGEEKDLLEIMGGMTEDELKQNDVLGYLTAGEVFKRIKYCYENNTRIYVKEEGGVKICL